MCLLVWKLRFLAQGLVDDATLRFFTAEFLHVAIRAGARNLTSFVIPAQHQRDGMLATHRHGRHRLSLCQQFQNVHMRLGEFRPNRWHEDMHVNTNKEIALFRVLLPESCTSAVIPVTDCPHRIS